MGAFPETVRLGRSAVRHDPRTLRLAAYLSKAVIPKAPAKVPVPKVPSWPMYGNDQLGDCTIATVGHMVQAWTFCAAGTAFTMSEQSVEAAYIPGTGSQDDGRVEIDVLNYWRKTGVGGRTIEAYAAIDAANHKMVKAACWLFGGVYVGLALPLTAQGKTSWTSHTGTGPDAEPGSWGGHAVPIVGYDRTGAWVVTWGTVLKASWGFLGRYMDEAYAVLSPDWFANGKSVNGFDHAALLADLAAI